jgi:hypothetical protein
MQRPETRWLTKHLHYFENTLAFRKLLKVMNRSGHSFGLINIRIAQF